MDSATAKSELVRVIKEIQSNSGLNCPELTGSTKPLDDVDEFCSKVAILATSKLAKRLEIDIPVKENVFFDVNSKVNFTLDQAVQKLCGYQAVKVGKEAAA